MVLLQFDDQRAEVLFQNVLQYVVYNNMTLVTLFINTSIYISV